MLIGVVTACFALGASATDEAPRNDGLLGTPKGKSTMSADELQQLQSLPKAEQRRRLDIVVAAHPDDLAARLLRMQAEYDLNDPSAVVADSEVILASPRLDGPSLQSTLEWRAECLLHLHRFDESIAIASQVLALYPSNAGALFTRGWARNFVDQRDAAIADLDRALEISPKEGIGYFRRASVLAEQQKFDRAEKDYERAIEFAPQDEPSHREYGALLYRTGDLERAMVQFDIAARLDATDVSLLTWRAQGNRALHRFDEAAADDKLAEQSAASAQALADAIINVAVDLENAQDPAGAAFQLARALSLQVDASVAARLARTQWFSGQFGQALDTYRKYAKAPMSGDYEPLWLFVVQGRSEPAAEAAAKSELGARAPAHQPHVWTDTLVDMMLGRSTLEAALAEADKADTARLRAGRRCEADYYAAEQMLMHAQDESASRLLEEADRVCPATYMEARAVKAQRRQLAGRTPAR